MKNFINQCRQISGQLQYQGLFEELYQVAINGMNIGGGASVYDSGELQVIHYVKSKVKNSESAIIFDVGANIGHYTLLLKQEFGATSIIHSFEPSLITYEKLRINTGNNANIFLHNFGFGNEVVKAKLYTDSAESGLASLYKRRLNHFNIYMDKVEEISIETIDSFCKDKIEHIHFLKLDVEGNEINILNGAKQMIEANKIDFIQFEFGGCNIDSRTYFQDFYYLLNDKYVISRIVKDGLYPITQYKEIYESFMTTNFLAERRK